MTSLHARNPQAAAAASPQIDRFQVTVTGIDLSKIGQTNTDPRGIATTIDNFGKYRQIGVSTVVGSGAYPQVGELWVVDKSLGTWTFCSRQQPLLPVASDAYTLGQGLQQLGILKVNPSWLPPVSPAPFPPPPVTTGTTLQTAVDHLGDVWIAKNGVNGGSWKRPRDVLHASYYRNAAFTPQTSSAIIICDTLLADDYSLYNPTNGVVTLPLTGWWRVTQSLGATATGSNWIQIIGNFTNSTWSVAHSSVASATVWAQVSQSIRISSPGATVSFNMQANTTLTGRNNAANTKFECDYMGTG
jgi:hypothetical protein